MFRNTSFPIAIQTVNDRIDSKGGVGMQLERKGTNKGEKRERERIFSPKRKLTRRDLSEISKLRGREIERKREREGKTAVRRLVTRLAKVVSRTREKAVNDSTEGYLALCAARLDQQEAAQRGDVSRDFLLLSTDKTNRARRNTRNPVFARGLIIRRRGLPRENGSIRIAVRENRRRKLRREKWKDNKTRSIRLNLFLSNPVQSVFIFCLCTYDAWLGMVTFYNNANDFRNGSFFPWKHLRVENTPIPRILL